MAGQGMSELSESKEGCVQRMTYRRIEGRGKFQAEKYKSGRSEFRDSLWTICIQIQKDVISS